MLTLFVIFCHIANPTDCQTVMDVRGLHENEASCEARANELAADIITATGGALFPARWKCMTEEQTMKFLRMGNEA